MKGTIPHRRDLTFRQGLGQSRLTRHANVDPATGAFGVRRRDWLHCPGGVVWQADHAAAINVLRRVGDPDITLHTPYQRVRQIVRERTDRHRIRLPIQDSNLHSWVESESSKSAQS